METCTYCQGKGCTFDPRQGRNPLPVCRYCSPLYAAAPDMLEALNRLLISAEQAAAHELSQATATFIRRDIEKAKAAIAKAEGRE